MTDHLALAAMLDELESVISHPQGSYGRLIDCELARGFKVIRPGANRPFSVLARDWIYDGTVISCDGNDVRLVLICAKRPRTGAFTRLLDSIRASSLVPVVIAPVGPVMPAILQKWGWQMTIVGTGFRHEDQWRAP